ncbi:MAG: glycosyltransferase family 2 protein [Eubacteriales bacterium]|nr:glycosyltransferase family 2 protein [Eubacteriales bacterium]
MSEIIYCSVIVPVFNEELVIEETYKRLKAVMDGIGKSNEIVFVNDGSRDGSADIISKICDFDSNVKLINFSRNFGHQIAITAGMDFSAGNSVVIIDADLQDPPEVIPLMLNKWEEGYDIVYGKRTKREGETGFKKFTAKMFYRFLKKMTDVDIPVDTGDFRLIDRKVCDALKKIGERNRYVRGLISWLGFRQTAVEFERQKRFAGETKYPFKKMMKFAFDAIASFSYKPLKLASISGIFISFFSFIYLIYVLIVRLFSGSIVPGWASFLAISLLFNGIILIILGIIGEYIGRIYDEAKGRPLYIVRETKNLHTEG